jgi:hypothetical protein
MPIVVAASLIAATASAPADNRACPSPPAPKITINGVPEPVRVQADVSLDQLHEAAKSRRRGRCVCLDRTQRTTAGAQGYRERVREQDNHALVRQAHYRRDRTAVVIYPDATQFKEP